LLYSFLARLNKREKAILYGALFIVSLTALDRLVIYPIFSKMEALDEEIKKTESDIKKNLHILSHKDRILAEKTKYNSFLSSSKSGEEEMTTLLKEIEVLANENSIYLVDMKPRGLEDVGGSQKYFINLNCEAQMEQLTTFMYAIESSDRLFTIEKYQISPKSKDSSLARCNMAISKIIVMPDDLGNEKEGI
ncbi:MAG: hypothetical protein KJ952_03545, partial [Candidatus Omnitrophica bacterium]|nr:hypothetical protein [Candidatus Omnitrophota bacterium]